MRRKFFGCALLGLACFTSCAIAEDPPTGDKTANGHEWNLTSYLKGTAPQLRERLNSEVERLIARQKETQTAIADCNKEMAIDTQAALDKVRKSADYKQTLADRTRAEQELETARKTGTSQERLDAGSRFNKARASLEKMENNAVTHCEPLAQDRAHSYDLQRDLKRFKDSLEKATAWREELLHAIRTTYAMRGPVKNGSKGVLPEATIIKIVDSNTLLIKYDAAELLTKGKEDEGIQNYSARFYHTTIEVPGIDTEKMKAGDKINLDHVYVIDGISHSEEKGTIYSAKRSPDENDVLFDTIVPLRQSLATDGAGTEK